MESAKALLGVIGAVIAFLLSILLFALFVGGISYRKDCLTADGRVKSSWTFTWLAPIPYVFRPSEDGCEVHTGTRVAMNELGIAGFSDPTTASIVKKAVSGVSDPNVAYWAQLKAYLLEEQRATATVGSISGAQTALDKVIGEVEGLTPPPKYSELHARLLALFRASKRYGAQLEAAAAANDRSAYDSARRRVQAQDRQYQTIIRDFNRLHATD